MASAALTSLALVFLVAGITLLLVSVALTRRARHYQQGMHTLLTLASQPLEPLDIAAAAWPVLHSAGWQTLAWHGNWYGQAVAGQLGQPGTTASQATEHFQVNSADEVTLHFHLQHSVARGERRLFASQLAQVMLLLIETRLRERTGALSAALAERARLSLYLQHDTRNLAQWVSWISADFAGAASDAELLACARRLQGNAPFAQERAQRLNQALANPVPTEPVQSLSVHDALAQAARIAGLDLHIRGDAQAWLAPNVMARVLDNLLANMAAEWREGLASPPQAQVLPNAADAVPPATVRLVLTCPVPASGLHLPPEKLFEPFASGRPGGLGLGLYQARQNLRESGGDISASMINGQLQFELRLPQAGDAPVTVAPI